MAYFLYCILSSVEARSPGALVGLDDHPVFFVSHNGLSAAISRINRLGVTFEISRILAYQRVVESFHCHPGVEGVIPVRYGSLFEEKPQIIRHLKERSKHYKALLKELEGCVEMGIRVLIADCRLPIADYETPIQQLETRNAKLETSGTAYLAARKAHYAQQGKYNEQARKIIKQYHSAFSGLFVKWRTEFAPIVNPWPIPDQQEQQAFPIPGPDHSVNRDRVSTSRHGGHQSSIDNRQSTIPTPLLSLYFLVQTEHVKRFQQVFREISVLESPKLLLSGPWPPYNFVQPDHIYDQKSTLLYPCGQGDLRHFYEGITTKSRRR